MTLIPLSASMALLGRSEILVTDNSTENQSNKSILQHLYFIIAVIIALLLVASRLYFLRRRNRSAKEFFSIGPSNSYHSEAPGNDTFSSSYQPSRLMPLAPLPSVHRPNRRVNAADTDSAGRRFGGPDDPDWDGKDILPAYNKFDRPPKYDFSGVAAQGYIPPAENHPRDNAVVASTEAIPVVEDQNLASVGTDRSDGVDSAPSAPRHEYLQAHS
ncbi:hypothetical protein DEU56DRAFT_791751 [Suillus clintonianus]|uniref:uncharacterized protein n=1 Tax=Suillus clintonianus TaxID=1904413 RepID=UPI001B86EDDA|nr:uncharacterized protein DEU56DRAFT_791751 [Suillus clintonianus]KAG2143653.1 hypothetical protein DEU56DRAFT_791751 [Suillus clintonianus]